MGTFEPDQIILQRASGWNKPIYKPEFWAKVRSLDFSRVDADPAYNCAEPGLPRQNAPGKIVLLDNEVLLINWPVTRIVPIGAVRNPTDIDQTTSTGVGIARWDGDALVIESVGFNNVSWLQFQGYFHTDQMKVTERFWRKGNLLYYNFTVDDPDVLMEPWTQDTMVKVLNTNLNVRYIEQQPCEPTGIPEDDPFNRG